MARSKKSSVSKPRKPLISKRTIATKDFNKYVNLKENGYVLKQIKTGKTNRDKTWVMAKK